jgi:hypothetical protein
MSRRWRGSIPFLSVSWSLVLLPTCFDTFTFTFTFTARPTCSLQ